MDKSRRFFALLIVVGLLLGGCMAEGNNADNALEINETAAVPTLPEKLETGDHGEPILSVYNVSADKIEEMNLEDYVMGVVAGEMKNDWPLEALKAQAILARTFVLKFCDSKKSRYDGADISTDVSEAQAYAPENINDRVRQAVDETRGVVMSADGEYPYAWFFAHAGGKTELPSVALDYADQDPRYLEVVDSPDSDEAPEDVKNWTVSFTRDQVESGRSKTLLINGQPVSAPSFRIQIGANQLKSTLIDEIQMDGDEITFTGRGFGHGVGMSQWGAYALADEGKSAAEIVQHYFSGVDIVSLW